MRCYMFRERKLSAFRQNSPFKDFWLHRGGTYDVTRGKWATFQPAYELAFPSWSIDGSIWATPVSLMTSYDISGSDENVLCKFIITDSINITCAYDNRCFTCPNFANSNIGLWFLTIVRHSYWRTHPGVSPNPSNLFREFVSIQWKTQRNNG